MKKIMKSASSSPLLKNNAILFAGSALTGILNFALYPVLSRMLNLTQFGEVQILLALLLQFSVLSAIVRLYVVTIAKDQDDTQNSHFIQNLEKRLLYISGAFAALLILLSPWLRDFLQFTSLVAFIPLALIFLIRFQFMIQVGIAQAKQRFGLVSLQQAIQAGSKLVLAILVAAIGFGVGGVIWAVLISAALTWWIAKKQTSRIVSNKNSTSSNEVPSSDDGQSLKDQSKLMLLSGAVSLSVFGLLSFDTIIVKHFFSPEDAGRYAGVAIVARAIFYVTASVSAVLLASVGSKKSAKENARTLLLSIAALSVIGGIGVLFIGLFDETVIKLLVGQEFVSLSPILLKLCIAIFFVSIINLILYYHLGVRDYIMGTIAIVGAALSYVSIYNFHDTFEQIADNFILASAWFLLAVVLRSAVWHIKQLKEQATHGT